MITREVKILVRKWKLLKSYTARMKTQQYLDRLWQREVHPDESSWMFIGGEDGERERENKH